MPVMNVGNIETKHQVSIFRSQYQVQYFLNQVTRRLNND